MHSSSEVKSPIPASADPRRELLDTRNAAYIKQVVDAAPPLSPAHWARLGRLLRGSVKASADATGGDAE